MSFGVGNKLIKHAVFSDEHDKSDMKKSNTSALK
jgi:hypothetical protein